MVASYCGQFCLKCALYIVNTILTIFSLVIVVVGATVLYLLNQGDDSGSDSSLFDLQHLSTASILILVVGVLLVLFVFCGCCGAFLGAGWMLIWFAVIMGLLLVSECVIIGYAWKFTDRRELEKTLDSTYLRILDIAEKAKKEGDQQVALASLQWVQDRMECCGAHGKDDYASRGLDGNLYCRNEKGGTYQKGCTQVTADFLEKNSNVIGGVVAATIFAQLLAICIAIFLYCTIA